MRKLSLIAALSIALPLTATAQAGFYPSFQPTSVAEREYNFALADFDGGNALVFQWREGLGNQRLQFTADLGFADFEGAGNNDAGFVIGGSMHYQLTRATSEMPFDMVLGGGMGVTVADNFNVFRIPFGIAIGHRFPLEQQFAITPFIHPRLSIDRTSVDGLGNDTETNLDIDIGGAFEFNERMQVRLSATLGDADAVGVSFVWLPRGLRR